MKTAATIDSLTALADMREAAGIARLLLTLGKPAAAASVLTAALAATGDPNRVTTLAEIYRRSE